jgi:hypothetical protein
MEPLSVEEPHAPGPRVSLEEFIVEDIRLLGLIGTG